MREIWKYFAYVDHSEILMPEGSVILHVGSQNGRIAMWVEVDPDVSRVARFFRVVATGEPFDPKGLRYVGSTQIDSYVWHVFEEGA